MLLVQPLKGSWPEPRPVSLITGDRIVAVTDTQSLAALQASGLKLTGVSKEQYTQLVDELVPEVMEGIDTATGKLKADVMPDYASPAAIADVDIRGTDGKIEEQYIPARLSVESLNAQMASSGGTSSSSATITTANITTAHITTTNAGTLNASTATVSGDTELGTSTLRQQASAPSNPAADKLRLYANAEGRIITRSSTATERRLAGTRVVTSWPAASESYLGDEAIHATTGEHRIYLGAKGWRSKGLHTVDSLDERDAITDRYRGLTVFCNFGLSQNHVWDGFRWKGTQPFQVVAPAPTPRHNVNDTNWRSFTKVDITDPGYRYHLGGLVAFEIGLPGPVHHQRIEVHVSHSDLGTATNWYTFHKTYIDDGARYRHFNFAPLTWESVVGSKTVSVDWRCWANNGNAHANGYHTYNHYWVHPA